MPLTDLPMINKYAYQLIIGGDPRDGFNNFIGYIEDVKIYFLHS